MEEITLRDYRCFRGRQTARLAPLTLIVGENGTGKTSFMAMIRALWDIAYRHSVPNFKEQPYDLGSFFEIAHHRGGRGARADAFEAGFRVAGGAVQQDGGFAFDVTFVNRGAVPFPAVRRIACGAASVTAEQKNGSVDVAVDAGGVQWGATLPGIPRGGEGLSLAPMYILPTFAQAKDVESESGEAARQAAEKLLATTVPKEVGRPFASAPIRSRPQRTYDPGIRSRDPEGDCVPMYLADVFRSRSKKDWEALKARLEAFGRAAGLFDELSIKSLGARRSEPFQVQVRRQGRRRKGPWRNLMDVGYGVSQVLPLITELLRADAPSMFLLQQPEVHLHPSAQAALGTLFGEIAKDRQLIVESHSDYLLNRIRMDVRDKTGWLSPERVSVLYFERDELDVRIHSLGIDAAGNIVGAPPSYGRFFIEENERSLRY